MWRGNRSEGPRLLKYLLGIITALIFVAAFVVYISLPQNMNDTTPLSAGTAGGSASDEGAASSGGAVTRPAPAVPPAPSASDDAAPPPPPPASGTNN